VCARACVCACVRMCSSAHLVLCWSWLYIHTYLLMVSVHPEMIPVMEMQRRAWASSWHCYTVCGLDKGFYIWQLTSKCLSGGFAGPQQGLPVFILGQARPNQAQARGGQLRQHSALFYHLYSDQFK